MMKLKAESEERKEYIQNWIISIAFDRKLISPIRLRKEKTECRFCFKTIKKKDYCYGGSGYCKICIECFPKILAELGELKQEKLKVYLERIKQAQKDYNDNKEKYYKNNMVNAI